jgi:hypothetical protein
MSNKGWIAVDLDGTLAHYDGWRGIDHIGEPVPAMLERVKAWLAEGKDVRIFTARVADNADNRDVEKVRQVIEAWCAKHVGLVLPITNAKDFGMFELWDDRCIQVECNTGQRVDGVRLGPTGDFPRGAIDEHDQGEIKMAIAANPSTQTVLMHFGKNITWVGFGPNDARALAKSLMAKAKELDGMD